MRCAPPQTACGSGRTPRPAAQFLCYRFRDSNPVANVLFSFLKRLARAPRQDRAADPEAARDAALSAACNLSPARLAQLRTVQLPDWATASPGRELLHAAADLHSAFVVLASCDPDYFRHFALPFAHSLASCAGVRAALHLHVVNPDRWIAGEIGALRKGVPGMPVAWSESGSAHDAPSQSDAARTAAACARFIALPGVLRRYRHPVLVADIDLLIDGPLDSAFTDHAHADAVVTRRDARDDRPWMRFVPSPLVVCPTAAGIAFADLLARYIAHYLESGIAPWGLDRIGLAAAIMDAQSDGRAAGIAFCDAGAWPLGASMDHDPEALRAPAFRAYQPRLRHAFGWVLPGSDTFFPAQLAHSKILLDRPTWEGPMLEACAAYFGRRRRALDIGAHVGFWSRWLAHHFARVEAFEPQALLRECLHANVESANLAIHEVALGDRHGSVSLELDPANTGMSHVVDGAPGNAPLMMLDEFGFDDVDFIKLDAEGYELFVLKGGVETLMRNRPFVLVEQTEWNARYGQPEEAAVAFLESLGARIVQRMSKYDFLLGWKSPD